MRATLKEKVRAYLLVGLMGLKSIALRKYLNVVAGKYSYRLVEIWCILRSQAGIEFSSLTEDKFVAACKSPTVKALFRFVVRLCKYIET